MTNEEIYARERILAAAIDLLNEVENPDEITIRQLAQRAGVGVGLINYHFQSKENLLQAAVAHAGGEIADQWEQTLDSSISDPVERLKAMLKVNAAVGMQNFKFASVAIRYELFKGEMSTCQVLLPVLGEIFGRTKTDQELRLLSFALVSSLQLMFIRDKAFKRYSGIDLTHSQLRDRWIDFLVDSLIRKEG